MKVGVHQPNFLPWVGFFNKIYKSDVFVIIDQVQYVTDSIANRNRIKNNQSKPSWLSASIKKETKKFPYNKVELNYGAEWITKAKNVLSSAYLNAPFFEEYNSMLLDIFSQQPVYLSDLNIELIKTICDHLKIDTEILVFSEMDCESGVKNDLILNICKNVNANVYLSGKGAKAYNDEVLFEANNIKIEYQDYQAIEYKQQYQEFLPNLSIIDALMNIGPNTISLIK